LTGIAGYQVLVDSDSQASPEDRSGNAANPLHAQPQPEISTGRGSRIGVPVGPIGPENQLLGDFDNWVITPAGNEYDDPYFDHTPTRRAGPHPTGVLSGPIDANSPSAIADQLQQSAILHGIKTNAGAQSLYSLGDANNDSWQTVEQVNAGDTLTEPISDQAKSAGFGWGTRDRVQSFARQNEYGFDSAHLHRRYADGQIPGNYMYLQPGGRPLVKSLAGPSRPAIGVDSPFTGDDLGTNFSIDGAILQNVPSEYTPPSQPTLGPSITADVNDSVVEWF
jgi:hypothetical protein